MKMSNNKLYFGGTRPGKGVFMRSHNDLIKMVEAERLAKIKLENERLTEKAMKNVDESKAKIKKIKI